MSKYLFVSLLILIHALKAQTLARSCVFWAWGSFAVIHSLSSLPIQNIDFNSFGPRLKSSGFVVQTDIDLPHSKPAKRSIASGEAYSRKKILGNFPFYKDYINRPCQAYLEWFNKQFKMPKFLREVSSKGGTGAKATTCYHIHLYKESNESNGAYALNLAIEYMCYLFISFGSPYLPNYVCPEGVENHTKLVRQFYPVFTVLKSTDSRMTKDTEYISSRIRDPTNRLFRRDASASVEVIPYDGFPSSPGQTKIIFFLSISILIVSGIILALGLFFFYRAKKLQRMSQGIYESTQTKGDANEVISLEPKGFTQKTSSSADFKTLVSPASSNEEFFIASTLDSETICHHSSTSTVSNPERQSYFGDEEKLGHLAAIVHYRYQPVLPDELSLEMSDKVIIQHKFDDGWAIGIHMGSGKAGAFPLACLQAPTPTSRPTSSASNARTFPHFSAALIARRVSSRRPFRSVSRV